MGLHPLKAVSQMDNLLGHILYGPGLTGLMVGVPAWLAPIYRMWEVKRAFHYRCSLYAA